MVSFSFSMAILLQAVMFISCAGFDELTEARRKAEKLLAEGNLYDFTNETEDTEEFIDVFQPELLDIDRPIWSGDCPISVNDQMLLTTVNEGHNLRVECLLTKGTDVDVRDDSGNTPLILAAMGARDKIASMLIEQGADLNAINNDKNTALILASSFGHEEIALALIDKGALLDSQDANGNTALILASAYGYDKIVSELLEKGADVHVKNFDANTAATMAASLGFTEIEAALVAKGAIRVDLSAVQQEFSFEEFSRKLKQDNEATAERLRAEKEAETMKQKAIANKNKLAQEANEAGIKAQKNKTAAAVLPILEKKSQLNETKSDMIGIIIEQPNSDSNIDNVVTEDLIVEPIKENFETPDIIIEINKPTQESVEASRWELRDKTEPKLEYNHTEAEKSKTTGIILEQPHFESNIETSINEQLQNNIEEKSAIDNETVNNEQISSQSGFEVNILGSAVEINTPDAVSLDTNVPDVPPSNENGRLRDIDSSVSAEEINISDKDLPIVFITQ